MPRNRANEPDKSRLVSYWQRSTAVRGIRSRTVETWELRIEGPNGFERSYSLASSSGEHEPEVIGKLILRLLPPPGTQATGLL